MKPGSSTYSESSSNALIGFFCYSALMFTLPLLSFLVQNIFLPSEYEKQKNLPMFYYNFLRRFWKSSYVIIQKVSYFQKYGQIIFLLTFLNVGRLLIGCSVDLSPPIGSLQISKLSTKKAKTKFWRVFWKYLVYNHYLKTMKRIPKNEKSPV